MNRVCIFPSGIYFTFISLTSLEGRVTMTHGVVYQKKNIELGSSLKTQKSGQKHLGS